LHDNLFAIVYVNPLKFIKIDVNHFYICFAIFSGLEYFPFKNLISKL